MYLPETLVVSIDFAEVSGLVDVSMFIFTLTIFSSFLVLSVGEVIDVISGMYPSVVVACNVVVVGNLLICFSI